MHRHHDHNELHGLLLELVRRIGSLHVVDPGGTGVLTVSEALALHELDQGEDLAQQDLAGRLQLEKSTVSRMVASLADRGLLTRERDTENRRIVRLSITSDGRRVHTEIATSLHDRQLAVLEDMSPEEQAALEVGLVGLLRSLASFEPEG